MLSRALRILTLAAFAIGGSLSLAQAAPLVFQPDGVAIRGYDTVAYFTEGKPVRGSDAFTAEHDGATWYFVSAENRDLFVANPEQYAPQYGGWCAFGVAKGAKYEVDPAAWTISDGKLYLNNTLKVRDQFWLPKKDEMIDTADNNWPDVSTQ